MSKHKVGVNHGSSSDLPRFLEPSLTASGSCCHLSSHKPCPPLSLRTSADHPSFRCRMTSLDQRLTSSLQGRSDRGILRSLNPSPAPVGSTSAPLVDFSSNDYLSFARSPLLRTKLLTALSDIPSPYGPPSSRLLDGNSPLHLSLEDRLATFFRGEAGLLFNSGFDANVGVYTTLADEGDYIVFDSLIHASVHDGMRASRADEKHRRSFKHNDVADLERLLRTIAEEDEAIQSGRKNVWVGVETLYSMDGDLAPLKEIVEVVERVLPKGNGHLVVDEVSIEPLGGGPTAVLTSWRLRFFAGPLVGTLRTTRARSCMCTGPREPSGDSCAHLRKGHGVQRRYVSSSFGLAVPRQLPSLLTSCPSSSRRALFTSLAFILYQLRSTADLLDRDVAHERACDRQVTRDARGGTRGQGAVTRWELVYALSDFCTLSPTRR